MGGLNSQGKSRGDTGPFEQAAVKVLPPTEATSNQEAGGPGESSLLLHLPHLIQSITRAITIMEPVILQRSRFSAKMIRFLS